MLSAEELMPSNYGAAESPLDRRRSNQSILKETTPNIHWKDWCWTEAPVIWPPDAKSWLTGKDPDADKDWRWEEKGMAEYEMVGWHHWFNGHEFEQGLGDSDGQGSLVCYNPRDRKEPDMTEQLNSKVITTYQIYNSLYHSVRSPQADSQFCQLARRTHKI